MTKQRVRFRNEAGELLSGDIYWPLGETRAYALFAHCFSCTSKSKAAVTIARALSEAGLAVLTFDFTGLGGSEGDFSDSNFSANVADIRSAAQFLQREYEAPAVLIGHSLGGTAVLAAAADIDACRAVATIAAPSTPGHVAKLFAGHEDEILTDGQATVEIGERPFLIRKQFLDDLASHDVLGKLDQLRRALLILHSPLDSVVSIDNAAELFGAAMHPKSFISLNKADHLLSDGNDARYAATVIAAWAGQFLPPDMAIEAGDAETRGARAVTGREGFTTPILIGRHRLLADEPLQAGGQGLGPTPYDLLAAALASCTSMTLQMYARHKQLELDEVAVRVSHKKIHAEDCHDCEAREGRVDRFDRELRLNGRLDGDARRRLAEIADRCPVHRTLHGEVSIVTRLLEEA